MLHSSISRRLAAWFSATRVWDYLNKPAKKPASIFRSVKLRFEVLESRDVPSADPFPIFSTGVDANGSPLTAGTSDQHYAITAAPSPDTTGSGVVTNSGYPFPAWMANSSASQWISPHANENGASHGTKEPAGNFTYTTTFLLDGFVPSSAQLNVQMEGDNTITQVLLNGTATSYTSSGTNDFASFRTLTLNSGFQAGVNTLAFIVNNATGGGSQNAAGFRRK